MVREAQEQDAEKTKAEVAAEMRSSFCATPNGREAVAVEAAKSLTDSFEPCPEIPTTQL